MYLKGIKVKKRSDLGWRRGNPEKDFDLDGNPVQSNYVSIVRIKDCRIYDKDGRNYYDANEAPSIPIGYGGTYYGYGPMEIRTSQRGVYIGEEWRHIYQQATAYFVQDGKVYSGSIKQAIGLNTFRRIFRNPEQGEQKAKKQLESIIKAEIPLEEEYFRMALQTGKYHWFEPFLDSMKEEERMLYQKYSIKNILKNE